MTDDGRLARYAPVAAVVVTAVGIALGVWWRAQQPRRAEVPLAAEALALFGRWGRGDLRLEAGPASLAMLGHWIDERHVAVGGSGDLLRVRGPLPRFEARVDGAGVVEVAGQPALAAGLETGEGRALLLVLDPSASVLLGSQASRLLDEWHDYAFEGDEGNAVVWARGGNLFALAGRVPPTLVRHALPPPAPASDVRARLRPPEEHFHPPEDAGTEVPRPDAGRMGSPDPSRP